MQLPSPSGTWDSLLDGPADLSHEKRVLKKRFVYPRRIAPSPVRFGLGHLLSVVGLAGIFSMSVRSLIHLDPLGILVWPVLAGFGTDRMIGGHGVLGGTVGAVLSFSASTWIASTWPELIGGYWSDPRSLALFVLSLGAGTCWGFYLSVWAYLLVETVRQYL